MEGELPVRKRSSTETLLVEEFEPGLQVDTPAETAKNVQKRVDKSRRRSSWQFIDVLDSPSYSNSADMRELHFQFPENHVLWLYRVDNEYAKAAKVLRNSVKEPLPEEQQKLVDVCENGIWTKYAKFPVKQSLEIENASKSGGKSVTILGGMYDVDLCSRYVKPIYWNSGERVPVLRATWWKKVPAALGLVSGTLYSPMTERESLAAEAAMLMFYQTADKSFLTSRSDKQILSMARDSNVRNTAEALQYITVALGPLLNYVVIKDTIEKCILMPQTLDELKEKVHKAHKKAFDSEEDVSTCSARSGVAWPLGSSEAIRELQVALTEGVNSSKGLLGSIGSIRRGLEKCHERIMVEKPSRLLKHNAGLEKKKHLVFVIHGIGETFSQINSDYFITTLVESTAEMRKILRRLEKPTLDCEEGQDIDLVLLPIVWADVIHEISAPTSKQLDSITLKSVPFIRTLANTVISDVLFYCDNVQRNRILVKVAGELNKTYNEFVKRNPSFCGGVSVIGHSLGSVIAFDLLSCQQVAENGATTKQDAPDSIIEDIEKNFDISKLQLSFNAIDHLFCIGSPLGMFLTIRGGHGHGELKRSSKLPTCSRYYNIFHEFDPVAYRVEPLIDPQFAHIEPVDLQRFDKSLPIQKKIKNSVDAVHGAVKAIYNNITSITLPTLSFSATEPSTNEKNSNHDVSEATNENREPLALALEEGFGMLNASQRLDFQLLSSDVEVVTNYIASAKGHGSYWTSADFINFVKDKIYESSAST